MSPFRRVLSAGAAEDAAAPLALAGAARALERAVSEAGEIARDLFARGVRTWTKEKNSPVTEADIAVDDLLYDRLSAFAPDYGWLSEESGARDRPAHRRTWVIDPIDGTRAFIKGYPDWVIAAALVEDGRPLAAALYAPVTEELFLATAGGSATRNGVPLRASSTATLEGARIAGPRASLERLARAGHAIEPVPRIHSLALRFARVASGELDAALASADSRNWDLAAADLLVHEAGAVLTTIGGARLAYDLPETAHKPLAAAGTGLHPVLLSALQQLDGGKDGTNSTRAVKVAET